MNERPWSSSDRWQGPLRVRHGDPFPTLDHQLRAQQQDGYGHRFDGCTRFRRLDAKHEYCVRGRSDVAQTNSSPDSEYVPDGKLLAGAVVLAALTGVVHLWLAVHEWAELEEALPFLLAGIGFFVGIGLVLSTDRYRQPLYLLGAAFTGIEIPLWVLGGMEEFTLGVFDKVVQVLLVGALLYLWFQSRSADVTASHN